MGIISKSSQSAHYRMLILLASPLIVVLALMAVFAFLPGTSQITEDDLPPREAVPPFMFVYPEPGSTITVGNCGGSIILGTIPIGWKDDNICITIALSDLLQPGDEWLVPEDFVRFLSVKLDGNSVHRVGGVTDGLLLTMNNGGVAGGPYGICWAGTRQLGNHIVSFEFLDRANYTWWYRIDESGD